VEARNELDSYAYQVANTLRGEEAERLLDDEEREELMEQVSEVMEWMDEATDATKEDYILKKKQLQEAAREKLNKIKPPPPKIKPGEIILSPLGSLIEFID
jgi:heat shock protein 1/8